MPEIADLLLMQQRLRLCRSLLQFGHFVVNDSDRIVSYQTAAMWNGMSGRLHAVSGLPEPVPNVPFTDWCTSLCRSLDQGGHAQSTAIQVADIAEPLRMQWQEFLPAHVAWVPLTVGEERVGALLLGRTESWAEAELRLLDYWGGAVGHGLHALEVADRLPSWHWRRLLERRVVLAVAAVIFVLMLLPVSLSVNATAEVVARNPMVVRSPLGGIVGDVLVQPNQSVAVGEPILSFDETNLKAQLDVMNQELAIARAELQRANQASVTNRSVSAELPMLQARVEQSEARYNYTRSLLDRSRIFAERAGIVIIASKGDLLGKPVQTGEKLFTLAEPGEVEMEFWLAVGDSIPLSVDAEVDLFLNVYPERIHHARMRFLSYQAEVSPDGILGFRGRATLEDPEQLRVGWRGTAKLYGEKVTLFYFLFRRPLSAIRQIVGL